MAQIAPFHRRRDSTAFILCLEQSGFWGTKNKKQGSGNNRVYCSLKSSRFYVILWVNVTTGCYTLVKTRHSRVPTYLQRETDTADWSTPTFTLPCPRNGGVYPATSTFLTTVPRFSELYPDLAGSGTLPSAIFSAICNIHFPLPAKDTKTQIFLH